MILDLTGSGDFGSSRSAKRRPTQNKINEASVKIAFIIGLNS